MPDLDKNITPPMGGQRVTAGGISDVIASSKTRPADTTAYAPGDVINESTSAGTSFTFTNVARAKGGTGSIMLADLIMSANQSTKLECELWLFNEDPGADNDNALFTPTDAELETLQAVIPISTAYVGDATAGAGGNCIVVSSGVSIPYKCADEDQNLYGVLVARNAYTPVSAEEITARIFLSQD